MLRNKVLTLLTLFLLSTPTFAQLQWTMIDSPTTETLHDVVMVDEQVAYVVGDNGTIMKSTDAGQTFDIQNTWEGFNLNAVFAIDEQRVWAVGENSLIYTTSDGGDTWEAQLLDFPATFVDVYFIDENKGFLVYDDLDDDDRLKVLLTEDGGANWNTSNLPLDIDLPTGTVEVTSYQHQAEIDFPTPEVGYLCFTHGLLKSVDGGLNWSFQAVESQESYGLTGSFPVAIDFLDENNGIVVAPFQTAIGYTTDGATSINMTNESQVSGGYDIDYLSADDAYVVGGLDYAIHHLSDNGANLTTQFSVENPTTVIDTTRRFYGVDFWSPNLGVAVGGNGQIAQFAMVISSTEDIDAAAIQIYPNPVSSQLYLELPATIEDNIKSMRLVNHLGQEVWRTASISSSFRIIDMSHLVKGMYYLNIQTTDGKMLNRKVSKF